MKGKFHLQFKVNVKCLQFTLIFIELITLLLETLKRKESYEKLVISTFTHRPKVMEAHK